MIALALALFLQAPQADPPPPDPEIERQSFKVAEGFEVNLFDLAGTEGQPLTQNGIHLNDRGYRAATVVIERALGLAPLTGDLDCPSGGPLTLTNKTLPCDPRKVRAPGLTGGRFVLKIDGIPAATATAAEWAQGVGITKGPEFDQLEKLRELIAEKNRHYFHYWRPQNDTYIFGYRKHEQGRNAVEVPNFLKMVADKEAQVAAMATPDVHVYELKVKGR